MQSQTALEGSGLGSKLIEGEGSGFRVWGGESKVWDSPVRPPVPDYVWVIVKSESVVDRSALKLATCGVLQDLGLRVQWWISMFSGNLEGARRWCLHVRCISCSGVL